MKFPYARYEVDPSPTIPHGILFRPEIEITVGGPRLAVTIQALLDTGSDETVFPASLAVALGIELHYDAVGRASAVGGHSVRLVPGSATLLLAQGAEELRWQTMVAFQEVDDPQDEVALLGYAGFLEFFEARFDSGRYEVTLLPNNRFRRTQAHGHSDTS